MQSLFFAYWQDGSAENVYLQQMIYIILIKYKCIILHQARISEKNYYFSMGKMQI